MDIINPMCKECTHLNDIEPYVCITCKNGNHFNNRTELKPCPFCGSEAIIKYILGREAVVCQGCNAEMCGDYTPIDILIEMWNRRTENG